jgi:hypothetical protein
MTLNLGRAALKIRPITKNRYTQLKVEWSLVCMIGGLGTIHVPIILAEPVVCTSDLAISASSYPSGVLELILIKNDIKCPNNPQYSARAGLTF